MSVGWAVGIVINQLISGSSVSVVGVCRRELSFIVGTVSHAIVVGS